MKITHLIFLAFLVILAIVMAGFVMNLRLLFEMVKAQEQVDEEWTELSEMVEVRKIIPAISEEIDHLESRQAFSRDLTWNISLLQEKIDQISSEMVNETAQRPTEHHEEEEARFGEFVSQMTNFLRKLPASSRVDRWAADLDLDTRESLLKAERAVYQLQYTDMSQMMEAVHQAEKLRKAMIRSSLGIFVVLVLTIIVFSLWFTWIFRRKTDNLIRDEQLLTVAVMAQSLAHEIRNPLGIIKSSVSVLKNKMESDPEGRELLGYLVEEVDRIDDLLKQLLRLSEGSAVHQEEDIRAIITAVCSLMRPQAEKAGIEVVYIDETSGVQISCNAGQMKQLLINLIFNAVQASSPGQDIRIETSMDKGMYRLVVRDQGRGMDKKILKRLFEPFFTTKTQGAGLGLVIVKKIADWHKARIHVTSGPGKGTVFEIYFPA